MHPVPIRAAYDSAIDVQQVTRTPRTPNGASPDHELRHDSEGLDQAIITVAA